MKLKTRRKLLWFSVILFLVITPPIIFYTTGWRFTEDFKIKKVGGLFVSVPESGAEIYLDNKLKKTSNLLQKSLFIQNLTPRDYSVLVAKEGFWSWAKTLNVKESSVAEASALLVPQSPEGEVLIKGSFQEIYASPFDYVLMMKEGKTKKAVFYLPDEDEFLLNINSQTTFLLSDLNNLEGFEWKEGGIILLFPQHGISIIFDFDAKSLSASKIEKPESAEQIPLNQIIFDSRKDMRVWWDNSTKELWAEWLSNALPPYYFHENKTIIFKGRSEIRSVNFFPGRRDILVVSSENTVFAIEIDGRKPRNFQPIYKGKAPRAATFFGDNSVYILDSNVVSRVKI